NPPFGPSREGMTAQGHPRAIFTRAVRASPPATTPPAAAPRAADPPHSAIHEVADSWESLGPDGDCRPGPMAGVTAYAWRPARAWFRRCRPGSGRRCGTP